MKTLEQRRAYWERGRDIVGHWTFVRQQIHITIMREAHSLEYTLVRYFKVGEGFEASCDLSCAAAGDVFARLAYLTGGV